MTHILFFDGSCTPNPGGEGKYGFIIMAEDGSVVAAEHGVAEKSSTCNRAEYYALIKGLEEAISRGIMHLVVAGDSSVVIHQMQRLFKVSSPSLKGLHEKAQELSRQLRISEYRLIRHRENPAHNLAKYGRRPH